MTTIDIGERIDLGPYYENLSRRDFLRASGAAAGTLGLSSLIERAYGAEPNGKTIVHTRDIYDRPDKVRVVEPERYRRIKFFEEFNPEHLGRDTSSIGGAKLRQRSQDPTDLAIVLEVDSDEALRNLPNEPRSLSRSEQSSERMPEDIPFEYEINSAEVTPNDLEGGSDLDIEYNGTDAGTAGLVCLDRDSDNPVLLTARHVLYEEEPWNSPQRDLQWNGTELDDIVEIDESVDGVTISTEPVPVLDKDLRDTFITTGDVNGYWTFSGLSDATGLLSSVSATTYGQASSSESGDITKTVKSGSLLYEARTEQQVTQGGDSGGPWVDDDDYYLGITHGSSLNFSVISVAGTLFDALNIKLYNSGGPTK